MSLVTIILTTFNSERYLARSIESCLQQTHRDLELLVVDGGSHDRTLAIVEQFREPRLRLIHQPDNAGRLPGALNLGLAEARGDCLTWTQDDCWYEPHAIRTMLEALDSDRQTAMVYADFWEVDSAGGRRRYYAVDPPEPAHMLAGDFVGQCFLLRREVYETIGPQEPRYYPVHEIPWRIRVAQRFHIQPLHAPLMFYTVHAESLTGRIGAWQLQRLLAGALLEEGHLDRSAYRRRLAKIDIDQAYDAYVLRGDFGAFWGHALAGARRNPRHLLSRGLWKLMLRSLLPGRARFRNDLYERWARDDDRRQRDLSQAPDRLPQSPP